MRTTSSPASPPRVRGDYPSSGHPEPRKDRSTPCMRGLSSTCQTRYRNEPVHPVYAGIILIFSVFKFGCSRPPRVCGENHSTGRFTAGGIFLPNVAVKPHCLSNGDIKQLLFPKTHFSNLIYHTLFMDMTNSKYLAEYWHRKSQYADKNALSQHKDRRQSRGS